MSDPMRDQYAAAAEDAERRMRAATSADIYEELPTGEVIDTVVKRFTDSLNPAMNDARACPHVAHAPTVVYGLAALPRVVACQPCIENVGALRLVEQLLSGGRRCDHCHEVLRGEMRTGIVQHGPLLLGVTLCAFCAQVDSITGSEKEQV